MMMRIMVIMIAMGAQAKERAGAQASEIWSVHASAHPCDMSTPLPAKVLNLLLRGKHQKQKT